MAEKNLIKIYVNATSAKEWTSLSDTIQTLWESWTDIRKVFGI